MITKERKGHSIPRMVSLAQVGRAEGNTFIWSTRFAYLSERPAKKPLLSFLFSSQSQRTRVSVYFGPPVLDGRPDVLTFCCHSPHTQHKLNLPLLRHVLMLCCHSPHTQHKLNLPLYRTRHFVRYRMPFLRKVYTALYKPQRFSTIRSMDGLGHIAQWLEQSTPNVSKTVVRFHLCPRVVKHPTESNDGTSVLSCLDSVRRFFFVAQEVVISNAQKDSTSY